MCLFKKSKDKRNRKKEMKEVLDNETFNKDGNNRKSELERKYHEEDVENTKKLMVEKLEQLYRILYGRNDVVKVEEKTKKVEEMQKTVKNLTFGFNTIALYTIRDYFELECQICIHCANFNQTVELNNAFDDLNSLIADLDYSPKVYTDFEYVRWLKQYVEKLKIYYEAVRKLEGRRAAARDTIADMKALNRKDQEITKYIQDQNKLIDSLSANVDRANEELILARNASNEIRLRIESKGVFNTEEEYIEAMNEIEKNRQTNGETINTVKEINERLEKDNTRVTDKEMNVNIQEQDKQPSTTRSLQEYEDMLN